MVKGGGAAMATGMLLLLVWLWWPALASARMPQPDHDYLLVGAATDQQAPQRGCSPEVLAGLRQRIEIPAPAGGWSGAPQAVDVFNVFAGEVMIGHGERRICGRMHDARTRDSRFRAGVGMVVVPARGDLEPIQVAWAQPLKPRWIPTVRLGAPSPLQQADTARLLVRTACIAIAIALALSALMGFASARDRAFLFYAAVCGLFVVWQAVLSGLSGYPEPWLPVREYAAWWLVALSFFSIAVLLSVLWRLCGGNRVLPGSWRWVQRLGWLLMLLGLVTPLLPWALLVPVAAALDTLLAIGCLAVLAAAAASLLRRDYTALAGMGAVAPFLLMIATDLCGSTLLREYRVEAIQLSATWFLMMAAYALNQRLGQLRRQRDEMQRLADTDALTGLPNRRAGLHRLGACVGSARGSGQPLTIGFLDIDLFKQINDRHGHEVGDRVLVAVAAVLVAGVRNREDVIRMGGEEFLLLLPGVAGAAALARLEQLRLQVAQAAAGLDQPGLVVTASIGMAELDGAGDDVSSLLRRADNAMYSAKRSGRNRVFDAGGRSLPA